MSKSQIASLILCIVFFAGVIAYYFIFLSGSDSWKDSDGQVVSTNVSDTSSVVSSETDGTGDSFVSGGIVISSQPTNSSSNQGGSQTSSVSSSTVSTAPDTSLTYKQYLSMTPAQQQAYYESYPSLQDFITWYNSAKAQYDAEMSSGVVSGSGDGFDIGDIVDGNK